ncbi:MAG: proprotein convertase P-domain-containing protein [Phycisphaerales bacterium]|nr:proprotein convertase P-domain-containing protein [Phycisphaerales bacterium]
MIFPSPALAHSHAWSLACSAMAAGAKMVVTPEQGEEHECEPGCSWPQPSGLTYSVGNYSPNTLEVLIQQEATDGPATFLSVNGTEGDFLLSVEPWETQDVQADVAAENLPSGFYTTTLNFIDQTNGGTVSRAHTLELGIPRMTVTPDINLVGSGPVGGPFPQTQLYRATSIGPTAVPLRVTSTEPWISLNGNPGPYNIQVPANGGYANITVSFNGTANSLPPGWHNNVLTFENQSEFSEGTTTRLAIADVARNVYSPADMPIEILDNTLITSTIEILDTYCIADVDVDLDIEHGNRGDLQVTLISPTGIEVYLHNRSGESYDNLARTYDDDGNGYLADGPGELHDFYPLEAAGTWTLEVRDAADENEGTLNNWTLKIASTGEFCPPTCNDIDVVMDQNDPYVIQMEGSSYYDYPLTYVITSLPIRGLLKNSSGQVIDSVPHNIAANADMVTFDPTNGYIGADYFMYKVNDGTPSEESMVNMTIGQIPNEDSCYDAFTLANGSWDYDTSDATTDGPSHEECEFDGQTYNDIWFRYVACEDGDLIVSTCGTASYDTDLVVYDSDDCDTLSVLGCNDDDDSCEGYTSLVDVSVTKGQSYLIRVGGWNDGDQGTGTILIDGPPGDCGDDEPSDCPGDLDGDNVVGVNDVLALISAWGTDEGDIDGDGTTDVNDMLALLNYYGESC